MLFTLILLILVCTWSLELFNDNTSWIHRLCVSPVANIYPILWTKPHTRMHSHTHTDGGIAGYIYYIWVDESINAIFTLTNNAVLFWNSTFHFKSFPSISAPTMGYRGGGHVTYIHNIGVESARNPLVSLSRYLITQRSSEYLPLQYY